MYEGFQFKRVTLDDEITDADSAGTSGTVYGNQPVKWGGELSEGAQKRLVFLSAVQEVFLQEGFGQYIARYISLPDSEDTINVTQSEGIASDLSNTLYNEPAALYITPAPYYVKSIIGYSAEHKNVDDISQRQMDTFSYAFSDKVDQYIATALAAATEMTNSVRGAQLIFAGGKTADSGITSSDVFNLSILNEAINRLSKKDAFYWNSGTLTKSALTKNTWYNTADDPFILVIGHDQKKAFLESSQFRDASEYGGNEVLLNGEFGKIFGVKIVISDNIPTTSANSAAWDSTTNTTVDLARCFLMKGTAAFIFAWGKEPSFEKMPSPDRLGTILRVWGMYAGSVYHADAIVKIDCATNVQVY
jgi:N4-gp56 family major capsid protein